MKHVAELAGVSPATVARVIYENGYVKDETRSAVNQALETTRYRPNMIARGLRYQRTHTIGLVVTDSNVSMFHSFVARHIHGEALKLGYSILTLNNSDDPTAEKTGVQRFCDLGVDGIIFCAAASDESISLAEASGVPVIQVERAYRRAGGVILVDPEMAMRDAVAHLAGLGHRRIAFIGGEPRAPDSGMPRFYSVEQRRVDCFEAAMARHGLEIDQQLVRLGAYSYPPSFTKKPGHDHLRALSALSDRPTAIICGADSLAASAVQAAVSEGIDVPTDLSIIGHDNCFAHMLNPPLSTIAQPFEKIGVAAMRMLLDMIEEGRPPDVQTIDAQLVLRQTTAPAPR